MRGRKLLAVSLNCLSGLDFFLLFRSIILAFFFENFAKASSLLPKYTLYYRIANPSKYTHYLCISQIIYQVEAFKPEMMVTV